MHTSHSDLLVPIPLVVGLFTGGAAYAQQPEPQVWSIDSAASQITIVVGKAGLFRFAGHSHEVVADSVSGEVLLNPEAPESSSSSSSSSVSLEIDATSLRVTGEGEPADDVPEVQRVMLSDQVLDVAQFPTITFVSREVTVDKADENEWELTIEGDLTLHGVERPQRIEVEVGVEPGGDGFLAQGEFKIKQTDFGMKPPGGAGGLVKAKDELEISFSLQARPGV